VLRRKLATTNPIESCLSTVQRVARNVKRWREGDQPLRWTATGLLKAEKKFRRIKGYQEILLTEGTLESLAPSAEGGPHRRSRLKFDDRVPSIITVMCRGRDCKTGDAIGRAR
jgi:hypothetical protein